MNNTTKNTANPADTLLATLELYAVQACRSKKAAADIKSRINGDYKIKGLL